MTIASDIYFELAQAKLAPDVPFAAAPDEWREAIMRGVGDSENVVIKARSLVGENFVLEGLLADANAQADEWEQKYEAAMAARKR